MILSDLAHCERYYSLNSAFAKVFDFVKNNDLLNSELGKIEIDGENIFIMNSEPECLLKENQVLEYHKKYLDIHILLTGEESSTQKQILDFLKMSLHHILL